LLLILISLLLVSSCRLTTTVSDMQHTPLPTYGFGSALTCKLLDHRANGQCTVTFSLKVDSFHTYLISRQVVFFLSADYQP